MRAELGWQRRAPQIVTYVLIALVLIFLYLIFMAGQFHGITDPNAMDYAQVAQNLAQGEGFTTNFIKPISLTRNASLDRHPDLTYPPIHPWFTSLIMRAMGTNDRAAALASGIPFLLTVPLVFVLTGWFFDRRTAWLATALHFTNIKMLHYAISGLEVCLLSLWLLMLFMVLYQYSQRYDLHPVLASAVGLLIGLIYLTKYIWSHSPGGRCSLCCSDISVVLPKLPGQRQSLFHLALVRSCYEHADKPWYDPVSLSARKAPQSSDLCFGPPPGDL